MWKGNCLSFGGRITLIKATLSSQSIYFLSTYKIRRGKARKSEVEQKQLL